MPDRMPDRMLEDMSDRMPQDLPVTTRINVMVGMTRSKVILLLFEKLPRLSQIEMLALMHTVLFSGDWVQHLLGPRLQDPALYLIRDFVTGPYAY